MAPKRFTYHADNVADARMRVARAAERNNLIFDDIDLLSLERRHRLDVRLARFVGLVSSLEFVETLHAVQVYNVLRERCADEIVRRCAYRSQRRLRLNQFLRHGVTLAFRSRGFRGFLLMALKTACRSRTSTVWRKTSLLLVSSISLGSVVFDSIIVIVNDIYFPLSVLNFKRG